MYDTVFFDYRQNEGSRGNLLDIVPQYLSSANVKYVNDYCFVDGRLDGLNGNSLYVKVHPNRVEIHGGSICKWSKGNNYVSMYRKDVRGFVEQVSDRLHVDINNADVRRLDVGVTLSLLYPVDVYLSHLGPMAYAYRLMQPHTVEYRRRDFTFCVYDKNREQRENGELVPELYTSTHAARAELRLLKRLTKQLNVNRVTGKMLYDESFYMQQIDRFTDTWKSINKINDFTLNFERMKGKKDLQRMGVALLVEKVGGVNEIYAQFDEAQKRKEISAKQKSDLRDCVSESMQLRDSVVVRNDAITEFDRKLMMSTKYYH